MSKSTIGWRRAGISSLATTTLVLGACVAGAGAASADADFDFTRISGDNRYETSASVADAYGDTANVIIANGEPGNYVDALSANYLAGVVDAPVLLTREAMTHDAVKAQIADSGATTVYIVGGEGVVSAEQAAALEADGYTVVRVSGDDRFTTNAAVIEAGDDAPTDLGIIATGFNFPDALGAGPLAYSGLPVGLSSATDIKDEVIDALKAAGVTRVLILGGETVVGPEVEAKLLANGITVEDRLDGADRAETSVLVANYAIDELGWAAEGVNVASGYTKGNGADALAGGALSGQQERTLLITKQIDVPGDSVVTFLEENAQTLSEGAIFGGVGAVSASAEDTMQAAAQSVSSNQDFTVTPGDDVALEVVSGNPDTDTSDDRVYTVDNATAGAEHQIVLVTADQLSVDEDGSVTFTDDPDNDEADLDLAQADITSVNGVPAGNDATASITPTGTSFDFRVDGDIDETVVPVVFFDANDNGALDVDGNNAPTEAELVGVGGSINYQPAEADQGGIALGSAITEVDKGNDQLVAGGDLFNYDANDEYFISEDGNAIADANERVTFAEFEAQLSVGDQLDGASYQPNPDFSSVFILDDITPDAPGTPTSSDLTDSSVTLTVPGVDDADTVTIYGDTTDDNTVSAEGDVYATATEDADADTTGFQVEVTGLDELTLYEFAATQTVDGEESETSDEVEVTTLNEGAVATLVSEEAAVTNQGSLFGSVQNGDEWVVGFNNPVDTTFTDNEIGVRDADGDQIEIEDANANFGVNADAETFQGETYAAGELLTVTLDDTAAGAFDDGDNDVSYPLEIVVANGITRDGQPNNEWSLADSPDTTLEAGEVAGPTDAAAPLATDAAFTDSGADAAIFGDEVGDAVTVTYDEAVVEAAGTSTVTIDGATYTDGTGVTITGGSTTLTVTVADIATAVDRTITNGTSAVEGTDNIEDASGNADGGFPEVIN